MKICFRSRDGLESHFIARPFFVFPENNAPEKDKCNYGSVILPTCMIKRIANNILVNNCCTDFSFNLITMMPICIHFFCMAETAIFMCPNCSG